MEPGTTRSGEDGDANATSSETVVSGRTRALGMCGGVLRGCARAGARCLRYAGMVTLATVSLLLIGLAGLAVSIRSGPVAIPIVAEITERTINSDTSRGTLVAIGSAVLRQTEGDQAPKLSFRDVEIRATTGELLMSVPELAASFHLPDLFEGELNPTRVVITGPQAHFVRGIDGRWRFGLGAGGLGGGMAIAPPESAPLPASRPSQAEEETPAIIGAAPLESPETPDGGGVEGGHGIAEAVPEPEPAPTDGYSAIARIVNTLSGEGEPIAALARLEAVLIQDATLSYRNAWTGEHWRTERATLRLRRDDGGVTAAIGLSLSDDPNEPLKTARVTLRRIAGISGTDIDLSFRGVRPSRVAKGIPELDWLALVDAPVDGIFAGHLDDDGTFDGLSGQLWAREGRFVGTGGEAFGASGFSAMRTSFDFDALSERLRVREMVVAGDAGEATLTGFMDIERGAGGVLRGLAGQLGIRNLIIDMPEHFAAPLHFETGEVVMRIGFAPARVDIASARLARGQMVFDLSGRIRETESGWQSDIRADARSVSIAELKAHWPVTAAGNARTWMVEHIESGMIDQLIAQLRTGPGEPQLSLDFTYRDLVSRYLADMPRIEGARGRGFVRLHDFTLEMDRGIVEPRDGSRIALDGSRIVISDLWGDVTPAAIVLKGAGPLEAVLALIDHQPLGLVGKLGLDLTGIGGEAKVTAALDFPLIKDLLIEDIAADAVADIADLRLNLPRKGGAPVAVAGDAVSLAASTTEMTVSGSVTADGVPVTIDWREIYGETPGRRELVARLDATPDLLASLGVGLPTFAGGRAGIVARISQRGGDAPTVKLEADLANAALEMPDISWSKAPGSAAKIEAEGTLDPGGPAEIKRFVFEGPGLSATGSLALDTEGALRSAQLKRVELDDRADLGFEIARTSGQGLAVTIRGRFLDLQALRDTVSSLETGIGQGDDTRPPGAGLSVDFDIDNVKLTPTTTLSAARGTIRESDDRTVTVAMQGLIDGTAPVETNLVLPATGDGMLSLNTADAGAFLRATGIAEAARDGTLTIRARLLDGRVDRFDGTVEMTDVVLREARTVERILNQGGVTRTIEVESGGLSFSRVVVPFAYETGLITLGESIATGPSLAVKLDGTIVEEGGALDLSGVISPAYAVTGALNNIPLLGVILSGGRGEGILAMTFSVGGTLDDPDYSVNPLSLLTPGFLRRIFTSKTREPGAQFLEGLERDK